MTAPVGMTRIEKAKETRSAIRLAIATALVLTIIKIIAAFMTHSMSILASGLDSLLDLASSSVNLLACSKAAKPPDDNHAYGHEKIESLASVFQSLLIGVSGLALTAEAVKRFFTGSHLFQIPAGMAVMGFSILATALLTWRLKASVEKSHSLILSTETLHYAMDLMTNTGAILALALVQWSGWIYWDLIVSLAIAGYVFKTAFGILRRAIDELLDRSLPPVSKEEIEKMIRSFNPAVVGFHNFRSRRVGELIFMDFHIEIRGEDSFHRAHAMTEALIARIREQYPSSDITVHYDPEGAA